MHTEGYKFRRILMKTFMDSKNIAKERIIRGLLIHPSTISQPDEQETGSTDESNIRKILAERDDDVDSTQNLARFYGLKDSTRQMKPLIQLMHRWSIYSLTKILIYMLLAFQFMPNLSAQKPDKGKQPPINGLAQKEIDVDQKITMLLGLGEKFLFQPDSILHYTNQARSLFQQSADSTQHLYHYYYNLVLSYTYSGDFKKGMNVVRKYQEILNKEYNNLITNGTSEKAFYESLSIHLSYPFNAIGDLYRKIGNLDKALEYHLKALKSATILNNFPAATADSYNNVGIVYDLMGEYHTALEYYRQSELVNLTSNDRAFNLASNYNNIGIVQKNLGLLDSAEYYYRKGVDIMDKVGNKYGKAVLLDNIATLYFTQGKYKTSLEYQDQALQLQIEVGSKEQQALIMTNMALNYMKLNNYEKAEQLGEKAYGIAKINGQQENLKDVAELLYQVHEKKGQFQEALRYHKQFKAVADTLTSQESNKLLGNLRIQFETEKKEAENKQLQLTNRQQSKVNFYLITGASVLLLLLSILLLLYRRMRLDKQTIQKQSLELQKLNDLKSEFFANISHELKTPLTLAQGNIAMLEDDLEPTNHMKRVSNARRSLGQLSRMVEDLLDLSKFELGRFRLQLQVTNLTDFLSRVVSSFASLAEERQVALQFVNESPIELYAKLDIRQFDKVISNILYNAFKFTKSDGSILVTLSHQGDHAVIHITDTGMGIPSRDLPNIFHRFYQASNHKHEVGSGLGLSIVKEIVDLHHAKIKVESNEGKGTSFLIQIPVTQSPENEEPLDEIHELPLDDRLKLLREEKPQILLVEDHTEMQEYLLEILSQTFDVVVAENGVEGLRFLKSTKPSLIISDVMMPVMDGFDFLKQVKQIPEISTVPFILLTAKADNEDRLKGLNLGIDDYITKPFDRDELLVRVVNLIENLKTRIKWASEYAGEEGVKSEINGEQDLKILNTLKEYIIAHISNPKISIPELAGVISMSERQLYRKTSEICGLTPNQLIMEVRLQEARKLLLSGQIVKLSQLAMEVGIGTPAYLSKQYLDRFGKRPTDYLS